MRHFILILALLLTATTEAQVTKRKVIDNDSATLHREVAIARGLRWLAANRNEDGSWGDEKTPNAATAMGVLPFLGCDMTHKAGYRQFKEAVQGGLTFLLGRQQPDGSFYEPETGMLSHALATLCLTEAYAKTKDDSLKAPAQKAIDFIVKSQNPDGGWSQTPELPSDTLTTAWQVMALKSGYRAYLKFTKETTLNFMKFLDSVQRDDGSRYLRTADAEQPDAASTAAALLCRLYYGWNEDTPAMKTGVEQLMSLAPVPTDLVFQYHTALLLNRYNSGKPGKPWLAALYARHVTPQISDKTSPDFGSWHTPDATLSGLPDGGRLSQTAFSVMILETPYTAPPALKKPTKDAGIPLK